jgi:hypothetical protein
MPDGYEFGHACLNPLGAESNPDWDNDGLPTLTEYHSGTDPCVADTDGDGCDDGAELSAPFATLNPTNPWDFFSVPVPALYIAADPTHDFKDGVVSASDPQAVWGYFKRGAKAGTTDYEADLNENGIPDGLEYDRTVAGPNAASGPPDGVISASDAQLAFGQFKLGYNC